MEKLKAIIQKLFGKESPRPMTLEEESFFLAQKWFWSFIRDHGSKLQSGANCRLAKTLLGERASKITLNGVIMKFRIIDKSFEVCVDNRRFQAYGSNELIEKANLPELNCSWIVMACLAGLADE